LNRKDFMQSCMKCSLQNPREV